MTKLYRYPQFELIRSAPLGGPQGERHRARKGSAKPAPDFPENDWLTEDETVKYVADRMDCKWYEAEPELERACWDGKIKTDVRGGGRRMLVRVYFRPSIDEWLGLAPMAGNPTVDPGTARASREQCGEFLIDLMKRESKTKLKRDYQTEAIRLFGVSKSGFNVEWSFALKSARDGSWKKPGRRKAS